MRQINPNLLCWLEQQTYYRSHLINKSPQWFIVKTNILPSWLKYYDWDTLLQHSHVAKEYTSF